MELIFCFIPFSHPVNLYSLYLASIFNHLDQPSSWMMIYYFFPIEDKKIPNFISSFSILQLICRDFYFFIDGFSLMKWDGLTENGHTNSHQKILGFSLANKYSILDNTKTNWIIEIIKMRIIKLMNICNF